VALKALFFDFGGTLDLYPDVLEDCITSAGRMLDLLAEAGINLKSKYSSEEFYYFVTGRYREYRKWKNETLTELPEKEVWKNYILYEESRKELLDCRTAREITYLIDSGFHTRTVRPEAEEALENLKKFNLKTGIISNVLSSVQVQRDLERYGIAGYFNPVVTSASFGKIKPHSSIFIHAAALAEVSPEECVYIGNSPRNDIQGSRDAGFKTAVLIHYSLTSGFDARPGIMADYSIDSLLELPEIVEKLLAGSRAIRPVGKEAHNVK